MCPQASFSRSLCKPCMPQHLMTYLTCIDMQHAADVPVCTRPVDALHHTGQLVILHPKFPFSRNCELSGPLLLKTVRIHVCHVLMQMTQRSTSQLSGHRRACLALLAVSRMRFCSDMIHNIAVHVTPSMLLHELSGSVSKALQAALT